MTKATANSVIGVVVAVVAAVQSILVAQGVEASGLAAQITTGLAGVLAAYHGGGVVQRVTTTTPAPTPAVPVPAPVVPVTDAPTSLTPTA